jgi:ribonuclease-3
MPLKRPTGDALVRMIAERTGHVFSDTQLLQTALTHSSAVKAVANNERLEFLGDRVLSLVIAELLYLKFPEAPEGELAPRFNHLVHGRTCAEIGVELGLETVVRSDAALRRHAGGKANGHLGDAVEALIAAIYLDGGMQKAQAFIHRYWEPRSRDVVERPRNPKSDLQEWVARTTRARPDYAIVSREGPDHEPVFTVSLTVEGYETQVGEGRSRQAAEEAAATAFLVRQGVWTEGKATA